MKDWLLTVHSKKAVTAIVARCREKLRKTYTYVVRWFYISGHNLNKILYPDGTVLMTDLDGKSTINEEKVKEANYWTMYSRKARKP